MYLFNSMLNSILRNHMPFFFVVVEEIGWQGGCYFVVGSGPFEVVRTLRVIPVLLRTT